MKSTLYDGEDKEAGWFTVSPMKGGHHLMYEGLYEYRSIKHGEDSSGIVLVVLNTHNNKQCLVDMMGEEAGEMWGNRWEETAFEFRSLDKRKSITISN
jgi:hypothetical protein